MKELRASLATLAPVLHTLVPPKAARPPQWYVNTVTEHVHTFPVGPHKFVVATPIPRCPYRGNGTICAVRIVCPIHELSEISNNA